MTDLGEPDPIVKDEITAAFDRIEDRSRQLKVLRYEVRMLLLQNEQDIELIKKECSP